MPASCTQLANRARLMIEDYGGLDRTPVRDAGQNAYLIGFRCVATEGRGADTNTEAAPIHHAVVALLMLAMDDDVTLPGLAACWTGRIMIDLRAQIHPIHCSATATQTVAAY